MYDIQWDPETGGILLQEPGTGEIRSEIRPVFHEELDILGFKEKWRYPRVKEPLLWATVVGRSYFYRGEYVAQAKGGSFFQAPAIQYFRDNLTLEPVDVPTMLAKNAALLRNLAHEAIDFIRYAYDRERPRVDIAAVAFSGGKDYLTLLDLMQRALQPDEYVVVFNDTQMEITPTYEAVEKAKAHWPHLRFYTSRSHKPPEQSWREFGPPSRIHRWCCSVHKTVPNLLLLRQLAQNPAARVLVYDGVRAEESSARAGYDRISRGGKHGTQINVRPILKWNASEISLYLFEREAFFNRAYRFGLPRVGCSVCPMASDWSGSIHWLAFQEDCRILLNVLLEYYFNKNGDSSSEYLVNGTWKARAGGRDLLGSAKVIEKMKENLIKFSIHNPTENWLEWAKTIGKIALTGNGTGKIFGSSFVWAFQQQFYGSGLEIEIEGIRNADRFMLSHLRAIAQKAAYCVHCKTCEIECPTGALTIDNSLKVNSQKCKHCFKCLEFTAKGCLASKSLQINMESRKVRGIDRYKGFGMRKDWLEEYLKNNKKWWVENRLGNRQFEAMKVWLKECEIIENYELSPFGGTILSMDVDDNKLWQILWVNLARNSILIKWYLSNIKWGECISKKQLMDRLGTNLAMRTKENAINALFNLLEKTPLGEQLLFGKITKIKGVRYIHKIGSRKDTDKIAILYSIYRYAELVGRYDLFLDEFYKNTTEGPYYLFGIDKEDLKKHLLGLSTSHQDLIAVEFVKDLDNIYVFKNIKSYELLRLI